MEREVTNVTVDQLDHDLVHLTLTFKVTKYEIFWNLNFLKILGTVGHVTLDIKISTILKKKKIY